MFGTTRSSENWLARRACRFPACRPGHHRPRRRFDVEALEDRALLLTMWTVNSLYDSGTGSGQSGDLRYVITQADQMPGDNTITFSVTGTITLNSALPDLSNTTGLTNIAGPGATDLTVARRNAEGTPGFSIFTVDADVQVNLVGLTITGGSTDRGGGIDNAGTLTVINSTIAHNSAYADLFFGIDGGGIYSAGTLTVINSTISNNSAGGPWYAGSGGGIYNEGGVLILVNSHSLGTHPHPPAAASRVQGRR